MLKEIKDWQWECEQLEHSKDELLAEAVELERSAERIRNAYLINEVTRKREDAARLRRQAARAPSEPMLGYSMSIKLSAQRSATTGPFLTADERMKAVRESTQRPALVGQVQATNGKKRVWLYQDSVYLTDCDLDEDDVFALIHAATNRRRLELEKAHALVAMTTQLDQRAKRQPIPQEVKLIVWQRDGGRCVECGSQQELEYDHIIPLAMGGSNTDRNLQLLCATCNRRKGASLG